ncbi:H-NS family nucleoid-associated regulatory protein [Undibacterium sp. WLX3042]
MVSFGSRQPKWIKEWIESGKSLDLVRV